MSNVVSIRPVPQYTSGCDISRPYDDRIVRRGDSCGRPFCLYYLPRQTSFDTPSLYEGEFSPRHCERSEAISIPLLPKEGCPAKQDRVFFTRSISTYVSQYQPTDVLRGGTKRRKQRAPILNSEGIKVNNYSSSGQFGSNPKNRKASSPLRSTKRSFFKSKTI